MSRPHLLTLTLLWLLIMLCSCTDRVDNAVREAALPPIYPDYTDVTIPVNIAPLNFGWAEQRQGSSSAPSRIDVVIADSHGKTLHSQGKTATSFDLDGWHRMLAQNTGNSLIVTVSARRNDGWHTYMPFRLYVSPDSIDQRLCYRLLEPGYEVWSRMSIEERNLENFDERTLLDNSQFQGCINCHSFRQCNPSDLSLHVRGPHGATLLTVERSMQALETRTPQTLGSCVYPYWHPSGRYIAYSTNTTRQTFHIRHPNRIEVFDAASDLQVLEVGTNRLLVAPQLSTDSLLETYPVFSADGARLYFCAAPAPGEGSVRLDSIRYSLYQVDFDPATGNFGTVIIPIDMQQRETGSICFPRPSYDGRWLIYTLADYGQFSIWHHEADLWLLDLRTGDNRPLCRANSPDTESYHCWSSNSRWLCFSSRRDDGLFTRPYFCHIDAEGHDSKPFMLPQEDPVSYYTDLFMSYNVPELVNGEVQFDTHEALRLTLSDQRQELQAVKQ